MPQGQGPRAKRSAHPWQTVTSPFTSPRGSAVQFSPACTSHPSLLHIPTGPENQDPYVQGAAALSGADLHPLNTHAEALTPKTSERDWMWRQDP